MSITMHHASESIRPARPNPTIRPKASHLPAFGMRPQSKQTTASPATTNVGCWAACFAWICNLFSGRSNPPTHPLNEPLLASPTRSPRQPESLALSSLTQESTRQIHPVPPEYGSMLLSKSSESKERPPLEPQFSSPIPTHLPDARLKPRLIKSRTGEMLTQVLEEGDLSRGNYLGLLDSDHVPVAALRLKPAKRPGTLAQEFQPMTLEISNRGQSVFGIADEAAVMDQLLATAVRQAKRAGLALMVVPKSGDEQLAYREHGFRPLAEVLGETPPSKYANHLAVDFSSVFPDRLCRQDSDEFYVGSPPGWREERQKRQRWAEQQVERQGRARKSSSTTPKQPPNSV